MDITYVTLDASVLKTRDEIHDFLEKALDTPDYYGRNLDALHDVLTEIAGREVCFEMINMDEASDEFLKMADVIYDSMEENESILLAETVAEYAADEIDEDMLDGLDSEDLMALDGVTLEQIAEFFDKIDIKD